MGIVCCLLIMLWVADELSYDKFLPKYDRLSQVWVNAHFDGKINSWTSVPLPTYEAMKSADSKILNSCVTGWGSSHLLTVGEKRVTMDGYWVSEEYLEMFEYPLISGDRSVVLDDPNSIVITETLAQTLFGNEDPLNKTIRLDDESEVKVTGILKDIPSNSSFQFEYLIPWKLRAQVQQWIRSNQDNWGNYSFQIFVELEDSESRESVEANIKEMLTEKGQDDMKREFFLYPMERWQLYSTFENGKESGGQSDYVQLFTVIAILIIVIACINFMNLATARSERRAREVGIRKSVGSGRTELIIQFMGESFFIAIIAYIIAIVAAFILLPFYNELVEKELVIDFTSGAFWLFTAVIIFFTGLVSGSYPAFYLSSFRPVKVLKGKVSTGKNSSLPRKVLVVLQFSISIILIIGTIVILQQIKLAKSRNIGYDQEKLISVYQTDALRENYSTLKTELLQSGYVDGVTYSNGNITQINSNNFVGWPGKPEDLKVIFTTVITEYDYCKTMGIKVLMGRDFSEDFKSDSSAIIINKAALDLMGLEDPIGTQLDLWGDKRTLIGVIDNVLMGSVYKEVKPLFMVMDYWGGPITVRLKGDIQESLAEVKTIFEKYNPAYPFEYTFIDEEFQKKFTSINLTSRLANLFAVLTIFITGLGLFGLAAFTAEQRTKEIGIRKVLGATVHGLIKLMSIDFARLVIVAFILAAPLGYYLLNMYLERYPLRTELQWWIFPLTGVIALFFALFIVGIQSLKAAIANPAQSLRSE